MAERVKALFEVKVAPGRNGGLRPCFEATCSKCAD